jgi:exodeoxyribonuclease VII large subunit
MSGRIDLEGDGCMLRISFTWRKDLVEKVRTIPGRAWDGGSKVWRVPVTHVAAAVGAFGGCGFALSPDVVALLPRGEGRLLPFPAEPPAEPPAPPGPADALTVSDLNRRIQSAVLDAFPGPVWVIGEIQGYDRGRNQQHRFFELVEKEPGAGGQRAKVCAVLFASAADRIRRRLLAALDPLELRDGIEVRVRARVDVYVQRGQYQIIVEDIDTEFTLGRLELQRRRVLAELDRLGLRERNASLPWPEAPLRVGLLTSPGSDAYNDFVNELSRSSFAFDVTVFRVNVQGNDLESTMLAGLRWFAQRKGSFDVVCITRGGGSRTDLAWFDNLELALAVARHPLKVVCGIGHQRDVSVLDLIAHSEKTPTAAASALVERVRFARDRVEERLARILDAARGALSAEGKRLESMARRLAIAVRGSVSSASADMAQCSRRLALATGGLVVRSRAEIDRRLARLPALAGARIRLERERVASKGARLRALDPRQVLRRGFAIVRDGSGRIRTSVTDLAAGDEIGIDLRDGTLGAQLTRVDREGT